MTTHVLRPALSFDPLVPEARRRMRRRRALIAAVLVVVSAGTVAGVLATRSPVGTNAKVTGSSVPAGTRWCGYLDLGIGWRVGASSNLSCGSGRALMRAYILRLGTPAPAFRGYACATRTSPAGVGYRCMRGATSVIAIANH
jgi:hypothetical protein